MLKSQQLRLFAFARHIMTRGDYRKGGGGVFQSHLDSRRVRFRGVYR